MIHPAAAEALAVSAEMIKRREYIAAELVTRRALAIMPEAPELLCNLGLALWNQRRPRESHEVIERALQLRPDYPVGLATMGLAQETLGRFAEAEETFSRCLEFAPETLEVKWNRSLLRIGVGDFARGFADYECRLDRRPDLYRPLDLPLWRGETLRDKTVLVVAEQGHGDTMLFSRFLVPLAERAKKVIVCVSQPMLQLMWAYRHIIEFIPENVPLPKVDYYIHMGSLPLWYGLGENPPLPDPGLISRHVDTQHARATVPLPQRPGAEGALKVGICWTGNLNQERNDERTIPLREFALLTVNPMVWLYSLQHGCAADQIGELGLNDLIADLRPEINAREFVGTGCLMRQLDLVITCCTSVAHLAGVLGVPCWVLLCPDPYWIWGYNDSEKSIWYPSVRLYRQTHGAGWPSVINRVNQDLSVQLEMRAQTATPLSHNIP